MSVVEVVDLPWAAELKAAFEKLDTLPAATS